MKDKTKKGVTVVTNGRYTLRKTSCLCIGLFLVVTFLVLCVVISPSVEKNQVGNEKVAMNAFSWCTAIIEGATNYYGYAISGDQLSAIRNNLNKEIKLSEFRKILPFGVDIKLPIVDGRGREFTVLIYDETIDEDSTHYYLVDLNYVSYTIYGRMTSHRRVAAFSVRVM